MVPSGGKKSISCPLILKSNVSFQRSLDSVQAALSLDLKYYQEIEAFLFCFVFILVVIYQCPESSLHLNTFFYVDLC